MANLIDANNKNFEELVLKSKVPVLVDFWAEWCSSCKALTPKLETLAASLQGQATIVKVNAEDCPEIASKYMVRGLPSLLFFKGGEVKNSLFGVHSIDAIKAALTHLM